MKVLVTGATGYLGSAIVAALVRARHDAAAMFGQGLRVAAQG
jgi:uncharacterized protein YbjT (DUF2867 family)